MKRQARLRRTRDVERVRKQGQPFPHPLLVLLVHRNDLNLTRIGVVASRRVGGAVARNRAKRLLREASRHLYPHLLPGWDLLLIARPPITQVREPQVRQSLQALVSRAGLLKG